MLEVFYPDRLEESAYGIDYEALYEKGYRGIIYDVDNTLVEHGAPATARAKALFERLHGRLLHHLLHGASARLTLPARKGRAVVAHQKQRLHTVAPR